MNKQSCLYPVLALSLLLASSLTAESQSSKKTAASASQSIPGLSRTKPKEDLPNFHEVHPFLYRSGQPSKEGLDSLKKMGVKTVIDLRNPGEKAFDEKAYCRDIGLSYLELPMSSKAPESKQVNSFLQAVRDAKADSSNGKVLIHCAHGSDRTGCLVGIWRVSEDGWSYEDAYKEMRKYYFGPKYTELSGAVKQRARTKEN